MMLALRYKLNYDPCASSVSRFSNPDGVCFPMESPFEGLHLAHQLLGRETLRRCEAMERWRVEGHDWKHFDSTKMATETGLWKTWLVSVPLHVIGTCVHNWQISNRILLSHIIQYHAGAPGSMPLDHASVLGRESDGNGPCHVQKLPWESCTWSVQVQRHENLTKAPGVFFVHRNELHWWQWFSLKLLSWIKMMKFKGCLTVGDWGWIDR